MVTVSMSYNEPFEKIAYNFCNTIDHDELDIRINKLNIDCTQEQSYNHEECWLECISKKLKFSSMIFDEIQDNEILIQCDVDMMCINNPKFVDMIDDFKNCDLDLLGMCEDEFKIPEDKNNVNGGFYLIKKNERTKNLFNTMFEYNFADYQFHDQDVLNIILKSGNINYDVLETGEFTLGCFLHNHIENIKDICIFHATCIGGNLGKQEMIDNFVQLYGLEKIDWENLRLCVDVTKYTDSILM